MCPVPGFGVFDLHAALTNLNIRFVGALKPSASPLSYGDVWAENDIACMGVWLNYGAL